MGRFREGAIDLVTDIPRAKEGTGSAGSATKKSGRGRNCEYFGVSAQMYFTPVNELLRSTHKYSSGGGMDDIYIYNIPDD